MIEIALAHVNGGHAECSLLKETGDVSTNSSFLLLYAPVGEACLTRDMLGHFVCVSFPDARAAFLLADNCCATNVRGI